MCRGIRSEAEVRMPMTAFRNNEIVPVPLKEVAGKLKMVDPKSDIIREARDMGISFGNEL